MITRTLTHTEYNHKARKGYAGTLQHNDPATHIWRNQNPDWDGHHWAIGHDTTGTDYAPINIRN